VEAAAVVDSEWQESEGCRLKTGVQRVERQDTCSPKAYTVTNGSEGSLGDHLSNDPSFQSELKNSRG
jgi:hypothetical protein